MQKRSVVSVYEIIRAISRFQQLIVLMMRQSIRYRYKLIPLRYIDSLLRQNNRSSPDGRPNTQKSLETKCGKCVAGLMKE